MTGFVEIFIFFALFYWIFSSRELRMVDMVVGSMHKVYTTLDSMVMQRHKGGDYEHQLPQRLTKVAIDRLKKTIPRNQRRLARKNLAEQAYEKTIFEDLPLEIQGLIQENGLAIKDMPPFVEPLLEKARPVMGSVCMRCTHQESKPTHLPRVSHQYAIQNVLSVDTNNSNSYLEQMFCHLIAVWRKKTSFYPRVYTAVLEDERLKDAVTTAADEDLKRMEAEGQHTEGDVHEKLLKKHENRAIQIINGMRTGISDFVLKTMAWLVYKLIPRFIMSVSSQPAQIEWLRNSRDLGLPMIFLPQHRSHLDYILITFILLCNNIQAPLVAAGDNLQIPFFGWLLRRLGAFFIKRRLDPVQGRRDTVYRAVLHTYIMECLRAGHNIEFFLEGGRTRTGKICMPKSGLLSVIVDAYMDGTINDALLVPVSLNYEKLVDGNFVREQLGQPKEMESFGKAISAIWKVLNSNYGMMRIDFHHPFSLKELISSMQQCNRLRPQPSGGVRPPLVDEGDGRLTVTEKSDNFHHAPSSTSLYGTDVCHEEQRQLVESIARHVVYDCSQATAVMSTNAVAFLLLNKYRNGVTLARLVVALSKLQEELRHAHRDVGFSGEAIDVVNHALDLLGPGLIRKEKITVSNADGQTETVTMITPITMLPNVIELSYYSNPLLSHYVMDAVVVTSIYSLIGTEIKDKSEATLYLYQEEIKQDALLVCDILQYEFIFAKPCQDIDNLVTDAIERLLHKDILVKNQQEAMDEDTQWSRRYAKHLDEQNGDDFSDDGSMQYNKGEEYKLVRDRKIMTYLEFLHAQLRPLIDTYVVSALCLSRLVGRQVPERDLVQEVLAEMKAQLERGVLQHGESVAVDPIKASFKLFEHWQVLECHSEDRIKLYYLTDAYDKESEVKKVFELVNKFKWGPKCDMEVFSQED